MDYYSTIKNLRPTVCPAHRMLWDQSIAKSLERKKERLHSATDESECRVSQPNIR